MDKKKFNKKDIEIAPQIDVDSYHDVAERFFPEIIGMNYCDVLITDESSLTDFFIAFNEDEQDQRDKDIDNAIEKIEKIYGINVTDLDPEFYLIDIFKRIENLR